MTVLVTGATGNVGREVVRALLARGVPVRAALRDPSRAAGLPAAAARARLDLQDPSSFGPALEGAERVFLVRPPHLGDGLALRPFVRALRPAGVAHAAFLSLQGVNPFVPHWRIEKDLEASGVAWTHLRAGFFMQNLETMHADGIRRRGAIEIPAGGGRTSFVDVRDLGEAAAAVLAAPAAHAGRAYVLTGAEALGYGEVARLLSEALGRPIRYPRLSAAAFRARLAEAGADPGLARVAARIYLVVRLRLAGAIAPDLGRLLGRPPRTFCAYARDAAAAGVFARIGD